MKILLSLLIFPLTFLVRLISVLLSRLAAFLACRQAVRKHGLKELPVLSAPGTVCEARELMKQPPMQAYAAYNRKFWLIRFLVVAGLIDGILAGLGIMLQDGTTWIPLIFMMAMFTFMEFMAFHTGRKAAREAVDEAQLDARSDPVLLEHVKSLIPEYQKFREDALRATGRYGKVFVAVALCFVALLIGLQADWHFRPRKTQEPGVWQVAGFQYRMLEDGTAEVVRYTGPWKKIRVPSYLGGAAVTSVGEKAFYRPSGDYLPFGRKELEGIELPDTLRRIGDRAFSGCIELTGIIIPDGVTEIGGKAFDSCPRIRELVIPDSVTSIGPEAFSGCSVKTLFIPASVIEIGGNPFPDDLRTLTVAEDNPVYYLQGSALCSWDGVLIWVSEDAAGTDYRVPDGILKIADRAFYSFEHLESVTLPDSLTVIGRYAFARCTSLKEISLPDAVTCLGDYAFLDCRELSGVRLPAQLTFLGVSAFERCEKISDIRIPDGLTEISQSAFEQCVSLETVVIPEGVTDIRVCAFKGCVRLRRVTIPVSVRDMDVYAVFPPDTVLVVFPDSYAEHYAGRMGFTYEYAEKTPADIVPAGDET